MERKAIATMMMLAFLALTLVPVQTVSAKTLKFDQVLTFDDWGEPGPLHPELTSYWKGPISGGISGTCYLWETEKNYIVGKVEHFFEEFYIDLGDGWISGYDKGVWNFATFKYRASGRVTDASEKYAYLIGSKLYTQGTTTNPFDAQGNMVLPIGGIGTGFIGP